MIVQDYDNGLISYEIDLDLFHYSDNEAYTLNRKSKCKTIINLFRLSRSNRTRSLHKYTYKATSLKDMTKITLLHRKNLELISAEPMHIFDDLYFRYKADGCISIKKEYVWEGNK